MEVTILAFAHEDSRRRIEEVSLSTGQAIQRFDIPNSHAPVVLGNHFHRLRTETFVIVKGCGSLHTQKLDLEGKPIEARETHPFSKGNVITIEPLRAHTFVFMGETVMISISDTPFDPNTPDLNAFVLI